MPSGALLILSGPSGSGKDAISEVIFAHSSFVRFPTYTTRAPRSGEIHGVHYHFVDRVTFQTLVDNETIFDPVGVHDLYGVPLQDLKRALYRGGNLLLHLADASAQRLKRVLPESVLIRIQPPTDETLLFRLRTRGMSAEDIARRRENEPQPQPEGQVFDLEVFNDSRGPEMAGLEILAFLDRLKA